AFAFRLLAATLSTRLEKHRILDDEKRRLVYEAIRAHPGITTAGVAKMTGLAWELVRYHAQRLEKVGYVRSSGKARGWSATTPSTPAEGWTVNTPFLERLRADGYARDPAITRERVHATYKDTIPRRTRNWAMRKLESEVSTGTT